MLAIASSALEASKLSLPLRPAASKSGSGSEQDPEQFSVFHGPCKVSLNVYGFRKKQKKDKKLIDLVEYALVLEKEIFF